MKRVSIALLAAMMLLSLIGCAPSEPTPPKQEEFTYTHNGTKIMLNAEAAPIIAALGEPKSYTEETSCAFEGLDKTYFYGSFYLATYPMDGKDYVYRIWFVDDSVATEEGVRIGNSQAEVEAIHGAGCFGGTNAYSQTKGKSKLNIILTDGYVSSVLYEVIID